MADAIFAGLKLAYKGYQAYNECKAELEEFADDYDELNMRLTAMQPILNGLEGNLDDSLSMTLELAKSEQEKANQYTEELLKYTRKFKGHAPHFNAIATALAAKAISSLPGPLQEVGNAFLPIIKKHGVPEKAYAKFADKLHFLISALSAAASTQLVKNQSGKSQTMDRDGSPAPARPVAAAVEMKTNPGAYNAVSTTDGVQVVVDPPARHHDESLLAGTAAAIPDSDRSAKLKAILEENIAEEDDDFRAILLGSRNLPYTLVFGLWLEKKPHLLTVTFFGMLPASMRITTAPSTDYLFQLQQDKKRLKNDLSSVRSECRAVPNALHMRKNHDVVMMGLVPYVGSCCQIATVYCNCLFTRLTMSNIPLGNNKYTVLIDNKKIKVNGNIVFEPKNLPVNVPAMCVGCMFPCCLWPEYCC